jgi:secretion/DNA translocation related CpaE-like protein
MVGAPDPEHPEPPMSSPSAARARPARHSRGPADRSGAGESEGPGPLVLTRDPALVDLLQRLAAATGTGLDVYADLPGLTSWSAAGLVLVGADLAAEVAANLPRRAGVVVVGRAPSRGLAPADELAIWRAGVDVGAERVAVLPQGQEWVVQALAESLDGPERGAVVAVVGGCGGAGASVLSAAVAVSAALAGHRTLLADLDPIGGGVDLLLGAEREPGLRWPELARARGRISGGMLREALPRVDGLSLLSWDRTDATPVPAEASRAVAAGAVRGFDVVVVDLPRAGPTLAGWLHLVGVGLVVVPANVRAVAAAARVVATLDRSVADLQVVVRGPASGSWPAELVAESLGLPLFAELRVEPGLAAAMELGEPPGLRRRGPLARCAGRVLAGLPRAESVA